MKRIYRRNIFLFLIICIFLSIGCASEKKATYWDLPTTHRMPQTEKGLHEECLRIRQEIVRQNEILSRLKTPHSSFFIPIEPPNSKMRISPSPVVSVRPALQFKAAQNIAWLENRAAQIGCPGAFSSTIIRNKEELSFDECFKKCKALTKRTDEECFDACSGR